MKSPHANVHVGFFEKYDKRLISFLEKSMYTEDYQFF